MFDGNFRSRKEVNLSSGAAAARRRNNSSSSNSSSSKNKESLLRNAEIQRKQRHEQQRRTKAARQVQRCTRGWLSRRQCLASELTLLLGSAAAEPPAEPPAETETATAYTDTATATETPQRRLTATSHCIWYVRSYLLRQKTSAKALLIAYERTSTKHIDIDIDIADSNKDQNDMEVSNHNRSAPMEVAEDDHSNSSSNSNSNSSSAWISRRWLVLVTLQELSPQTTTTEEERQALFRLLQLYWPRVRVHDGLFLELVQCLSRWISVANDNDDDDDDDDGQSSSSARIITSLCEWALEASAQLSNPYTHALLASVLFGGRTGTGTGTAGSTGRGNSAIPSSLAALLEQHTTGVHSLYTTWVVPLAGVLQSQYNTSTTASLSFIHPTTPIQDPIQQLTRRNLRQGTTSRRILTNLLQDPQILQVPHPQALVQLIHHVLAQPATSSNGYTNNKSTTNNNTTTTTNTAPNDVALATSLLVRGDALDVPQPKSSSTVPSKTSNTDDMDDSSDAEDDDDDDDEEEDDGATPSTPSHSHSHAASKKSRSSSRFSRKELLTLPKLDKVYQDQTQQWKKGSKVCETNTNTNTNQSSSSSTIVATTASIKGLAQTIVRAPWLQWGLHILGEVILLSPDGVGVFVETLGYMLQSTTSLRPNTKVGILSPLAFHKTFLLRLWKYVTTTGGGAEVGLTVFCDLFAHYLVALSDVDFLRFHTDVDVDLTLLATSTASGSTVTSTTTTSTTTTTTTTTTAIIKGVLATNIIVHLRGILYDLYWTKPVLSSEVAAQETRGRLLLSGTKVWNSLHERWNRLVRAHSFCDESIWWFPHLASREGDGAVVPARERTEEDNYDEDDDDDDDDSSMDIDDDDDDSEDGNRPRSSAEAETDALADAFRDPKMARVLTCIPQALPFNRRVKLFHSLLKADKQKTLQAAASRRALMAMGGREEEMFFSGSVRERVTIRRAKLYNDSMQQLNELGPKLKHQVQVSFVNQHGAEEAGIDGGGVFKEFLDDLIKDGFASKGDAESHAGAPPLFSVTPNQTLAVNFDISTDARMLVHYEFLGRVLGKAVYESILVEPQFCLPFLNQLLGKTNSMEDLKNYDEEYYNNLNKLKLLSDADVETIGLTFEVTVGGNTSGGSAAPPRTVELMPGGQSVPVKSKAHVFQYIHAVANQLLNIQGARQTRAFLRGFRDLIPASWVRLFSANELQKLIGGDDSVRGIDVKSLKQAMHYLGGYHASQPYMQDFWDIVENDLTPEQQRKFLRFMTSCSRQPLLGFGSLEPMPSIQQIRLTEHGLSKNSKLPTSQTCMNLLKLPNYNDKALLKEKLLAAIESGAGFELT